MFVRFPTLEDLNACFHLDATVETGYVWQVRHAVESDRVMFSLQRTPLPRPARLPYPPLGEMLMRRYEDRNGLWVAVVRGEVVGFALTLWDEEERAAWLRHLVVDRQHRRARVGSALLLRAAREAAERGMTRMLAAVSVKNDPAIQFFRHHGFACVGYNEAHFAGGDFALYFGRALRRWL